MGFWANWAERVWNQGDANAIDALMWSDCVVHSMSGDISGPEGFREWHTLWNSVLDDIHMIVEQEVVDGSMEVARIVVTGLHKATGKKVSFPVAGFATVVDGKQKEGWDVVDGASLLVSMGVLTEEAINIVVS